MCNGNVVAIASGDGCRAVQLVGNIPPGGGTSAWTSIQAAQTADPITTCYGFSAGSDGIVNRVGTIAPQGYSVDFYKDWGCQQYNPSNPVLPVLTANCNINIVNGINVPNCTYYLNPYQGSTQVFPPLNIVVKSLMFVPHPDPSLPVI